MVEQGGARRVEKTTRALTPTEWMRERFKGILYVGAAFFVRRGLHPNTMTLLGLAGNIAGAIFLAFGWMTTGGLIILLSGPVDALDGSMARILKQPTRFGAFVDSVTDRWSETLIFMGLLYYYLQRNEVWACLLVFAATVGSVMVSYTKARAEGTGFDCNVGILTRMERYLVLAPLLIFRQPLWAVAVIAVLANFTALQRAAYVRAQALRQLKEARSTLGGEGLAPTFMEEKHL